MRVFVVKKLNMLCIEYLEIDYIADTKELLIGKIKQSKAFKHYSSIINNADADVDDWLLASGASIVECELSELVNTSKVDNDCYPAGVDDGNDSIAYQLKRLYALYVKQQNVQAELEAAKQAFDELSKEVYCDLDKDQDVEQWRQFDDCHIAKFNLWDDTDCPKVHFIKFINN